MMFVCVFSGSFSLSTLPESGRPGQLPQRYTRIPGNEPEGLNTAVGGAVDGTEKQRKGEGPAKWLPASPARWLPPAPVLCQLAYDSAAAPPVRHLLPRQRPFSELWVSRTQLWGNS